MATVGDDHEGVHNLLDDGSFRDAKSQSGLMVLDAFATWCGPCKMIAPKVVEFSKEFPSVRFYKIDVDELPNIAQELEIRAMPTFLLFKDGEVMNKVVGANPPSLKEAIAKLVADSTSAET